MWTLRFLLAAWLCIPSLRINAENKEFIILKSREETGLFSMCTDVLALLHYYEKGWYSGVEVKFGAEGLYYDPQCGSNWWNYYFEPIDIGERQFVRECAYEQIPNISKREFWRSRQEANALIKKYVHILPHITESANTFKENHFQDFHVIGIHYRGTDAPSEPSYEMFLEKVQNYISSLNLSNYKIFIATDESPFIGFMSVHFPNRICFQAAAYRAATHKGTALHRDISHSRSKQGEQALIDCLLLSKCSILFLTNSNLSLFAAQLNPDVSIIPVSEIFDAYINNH